MQGVVRMKQATRGAGCQMTSAESYWQRALQAQTANSLATSWTASPTRLPRCKTRPVPASCLCMLHHACHKHALV